MLGRSWAAAVPASQEKTSILSRSRGWPELNRPWAAAAVQLHLRPSDASSMSLPANSQTTRCLQIQPNQFQEISRIHTHTHPFNGPLSGTTRVSWYQKGKTSLDFTEARDTEWQWHQLAHVQVCTSLQTDNHTNTTSLNCYRPDALPVAQPTASKNWRQISRIHFFKSQKIFMWQAIQYQLLQFYTSSIAVVSHILFILVSRLCYLETLWHLRA